MCNGELIIEYKSQGISTKEIAKLLNLSVDGVKYHVTKFKKLGYVGEYKYGKNECKHCGKIFDMKTTVQIFCSEKCRYKYRYPNERKLINYDNVIDLYKQGLTSTEIANIVGLNSATIRDYLKKSGYKLTIKRPLRKFICENCGKTYQAAKGNTKYCSKECHTEWLTNNPRYTKTCVQCKSEFKTNFKNQNHCSKECVRTLNKGKFAREEIVNQYGTKEERELKFSAKFNQQYTNRWVYVNGFTNTDSSINVKCLKCNNIKSFNAIALRKNGQLNCDCELQTIKRERELIEDTNRSRKDFINVLKKIHRLKIKEQERIEKLKEYECSYCGKEFTSNRLNAKCCSKECNKKYSNIHRDKVRREQLRTNGKYEWSITIPKLIKRDKVCKLCGGEVDITDIIEAKGTKIAGDSYPSIDHIIPVSKGGTHTWDNVQLAHRGCNTKKNNKTDVICRVGKAQLSLNL